MSNGVKKPIYKKWWFIVIVVLVIFGAIGASGSEDDESVTTSAAPKKETKKEEEVKAEIVVTAVDLCKAFEDNEIKANKEYKDKLVEVTGEITDIGEAFGSTYIILSSEVDFSLTDAQCYFKDKDEIDKIADLSKGDTVTIIGKVDGKSLNIGIKKCVFK